MAVVGSKRKLNEILEIKPENTTNPKDVLNREVVQSTKEAIGYMGNIPSGNAVLEIIKKAFGSVYNILHYAGGPGAYLILGPSEAGKTSLIKSLYFTAQLFADNYGLIPVVWSTLLVFSSTAEYTKDLDWAADIMVQKPLSEEYLAAAIEERKQEMIEGAMEYSKETGEDISPEEWALDNPMGIILDDWNGIINASKPKNYISQLTTVVRKYGVYLFLLAQGFNQCGPVIKDNIRVTITLQLNHANTKVLLDRMFGCVYDPQKLAEHNQKRYHSNVFVRQWLLSKPEYGGIQLQILSLPPFPLYKDRSVLTKTDFIDLLRMEENEEPEEDKDDSEEEEFVNSASGAFKVGFGAN